jgi:hypothetical protein
MQKHSVFSSAFLVLVMSGNIMSMQILKNVSCNKRYPIISMIRSFNNNTYYDGLVNESNVQRTLMIRDSYIAIAQLHDRLKKLEKKTILLDLDTEMRVEEAIWCGREIKMIRESIERNECSLREQLDAFHKIQKKVTSLEKRAISLE